MFISYSYQDAEYARALADDLRTRGIEPTGWQRGRCSDRKLPGAPAPGEPAEVFDGLGGRC